MQQILEKINKYKKIIIHRHNNPDLDALGSQLGLQNAIKNTFPEKEVYVVGDMNKFSFMGEMDIVSDEAYQDALVIICDVAVSHLISDHRYFLAKEIVVIDHHRNGVFLDYDDKICEVPFYTYINPNYIACAEIVAMMIKEWNFKLDSFGATRLYGGIVTDSGRFQYGTNLSHAFLISSFLMDCGADAQFIYKNLYVETLGARKMKNYFQSKMQLTEHNVAYMVNDKDVFEKFDVDTFTVSRGMVNLMAGIEKVNIWCNFTYDVASGKVFGEFRSRDIVIVDIAKKYGGGGHECACGATIDNFEVAMEMLKEFDKKMEEYLNV